MTKNQLRKLYREKRNRFSSEEIDRLSMAIANKSLEMDIWDYEIYSLFLSIQKLKEIETECLLNILQGKDKNISISKSDFQSHGMTHYLLTDSTKIKTNDWGIPEPVSGIKIDARQIDVVFIPLLAFDKKGNRIGYGKGFYDRFLADCRPDVVKIGLSFFEAEEQFEEVLDSDIPLDYCITPQKIYRF